MSGLRSYLSAASAAASALPITQRWQSMQCSRIWRNDASRPMASTTLSGSRCSSRERMSPTPSVRHFSGFMWSVMTPHSIRMARAAGWRASFASIPTPYLPSQDVCPSWVCEGTSPVRAKWNFSRLSVARATACGAYRAQLSRRHGFSPSAIFKRNDAPDSTGAHSRVVVMVMSPEKKGTNFVPATNFVTEEEAAKRFAAAVSDYSAKTLAKAARRNVETAKHWKRGRRCPNGASLINMSRRLPVVSDWLADEAHIRRAAAPSLYAGLQSGSPALAALEARLSAVEAQLPAEPPRETLAVRDLFAGRH